MRRIVFIALLAPLAALGAEAGYGLDRSPHDTRDLVSLQSGARTFVNYCLGCHGAQYMRYRGLTGIGLSEAQIRDNLMFTADKTGEPMRAGFSTKEGKQWFGVAPPDLSVVARSRGADWLYTYLRTFYRDSKSATGWSNALYPQVAMPHALWEIQGPRTTTIESIFEEIDPNTKKVIGYSKTALVLNENGVRTEKSEKLPAGREYRTGTELTFSASSSAKLSAPAYDAMVRDLVNFLVYVGEPAAVNRKAIGIVVLFVLGVLFIFAYLLKKEFWKDVH